VIEAGLGGEKKVYFYCNLLFNGKNNIAALRNVSQIYTWRYLSKKTRPVSPRIIINQPQRKPKFFLPVFVPDMKHQFAFEEQVRLSCPS
jgi:hypothetical protein